MRTFASFGAVFITVLALIPGGAHLLEMQNKIGLPQDQYFVVQNIYRGWDLLGALLMAAIVADGLLAFLFRADSRVWPLALAALALLLVNLAIFFAWTYPANVATDNWTRIPAEWEALRTQWEYSHAVNAVVMLASFVAITLAALRAAAG